jgi:hypothetical protein
MRKDLRFPNPDCLAQVVAGEERLRMRALTRQPALVPATDADGYLPCVSEPDDSD